jgi:hypothetical protein
MFAALASSPGPGIELEEARESLEYWERRVRALPPFAVRRRREAREMAARWQARVAEAECAAYGAGLVGALTLLALEGRLPERARATGRHLARRGRQVAGAAVALCVVLAAFVVVAAAELLAAVMGALT